MIKKKKISINRIMVMSSFYGIIVIALIVRLYFLQVHPSLIVEGEIENYQAENLSQMNYRVFDTNGKDLMSYNKKYIVVLDTKPFMLNN